MVYILVLLSIISVLGGVCFKINEITSKYSSMFIDYNDLYDISEVDDYITYINEELNREETYLTLINNKKIELTKKNITLTLDESQDTIICKYTILDKYEKDNNENDKIERKLKYNINHNKIIVYPLKTVY